MYILLLDPESNQPDEGSVQWEDDDVKRPKPREDALRADIRPNGPFLLFLKTLIGGKLDIDVKYLKLAKV